MSNPDRPNQNRIFSDVVTIEAWQSALGTGMRESALYADVVFGTARLGGEAESPIRFRLSLRRAEVVIVLPAMEPVEVIRESVSRDTPTGAGTLTQIFERSVKTKFGARIAALLSATRASAAGGVSSEIELTAASQRRLELSSSFMSMHVTQSKTEGGDYRWSVSSPAGITLDGRAWDSEKPRLSLKDLRQNPAKGIPPVVRIDARCRREDLIIEDLELKNESAWESVKQKVGFTNRIAAAESYIRDQLVLNGLEVRNINDKFGQMTLTSVTVDQI